ncbi:MAG: amidase domain-containing protein [Clostridiales bacterium]|nr:amidase domain-containing protein [Clostridiales bacterium]
MYNRDLAIEYAQEWALKRNPKYYNFDALGGDCTNFISQCLFAGYGAMNFTPITGWYYNNLNSRTAAWTGVEYLYKFIISNNQEGAKGSEIAAQDAQLGDIIQLGSINDGFYHSLIITGFQDGIPLICTHTYDSQMRLLSTYSYEKIRYLGLT